MSTWKVLVALKEKISSYGQPVKTCAFSAIKPGLIYLNQSPPDAGPWVWVLFGTVAHLPVSSWDCIYQVHSLLDFRLLQEGTLADKQLAVLNNYLPYCFLSHYARTMKRPVTVAHFAQSLDGAIKVNSRKSRRKSDQPGNNHFRRMKKLCDGVLKEGGTLSSGKKKGRAAHSINGKQPEAQLPDTGSVRWSGKAIQTDPDGNSTLCPDFLQELYRQGIFSVLIEGAAGTISQFLAKDVLDILQLHISPVLSTSNGTGVHFPDITSVSKSVSFRHYCFQQQGGSVIFSGHIK